MDLPGARSRPAFPWARGRNCHRHKTYIPVTVATCRSYSIPSGCGRDFRRRTGSPCYGGWPALSTLPCSGCPILASPGFGDARVGTTTAGPIRRGCPPLSLVSFGRRDLVFDSSCRPCGTQGNSSLTLPGLTSRAMNCRPSGLQPAQRATDRSPGRGVPSRRRFCAWWGAREPGVRLANKSLPLCGRGPRCAQDFALRLCSGQTLRAPPSLRSGLIARTPAARSGAQINNPFVPCPA